MVRKKDKTGPAGYELPEQLALPPDEEDWTGWEDDLDARWAHKVFFGKDASQTRALFRDNVIERTEEISFMPARPFTYYLLCFADWVGSAEAQEGTEASSAASCFMGLVENALVSRRCLVLPLVPRLVPVLEFIAGNQSRFDADVEIFGDFREQLARIKELAGLSG